MPKVDYREQLLRTQNDARNNENPSNMLVASMMATSLLMQWEGADAEVDQQQLTDMTMKLMRQQSFKDMMKDPLSAKLARQGKHLELIQMMDIKENEVRRAREAWERTPGMIREDSPFLREAVNALKDGTAKGRPAELEKKTQRYQEMIKQVEAAQAKAQSGIPLSAAENKAMVTAIKKYIDGGTNVAGGPKKAPHFKEAMCVLKQFMPEKEFREYCDQINTAHEKSKVTPESFTRDRMNGKVFTEREIRQQAKGQLRVRFSEDACATLLAVRNLSKGDPNAIINPKDLEKEKAKLMATGSAFHVAMSNEKDREFFKQLATDGKARELGKQIEISSKNHSIGAAQWTVNRSIRALTGGGPLNRHFMTDHLASIYVARELAANSGPDTKIDRKAIDLAKENLLNDPAFQKLADRYCTDREYQARINKDLTLDKSGSILPLEVHNIRNPRPVRQAQPQDPQNQPNQPLVR